MLRTAENRRSVLVGLALSAALGAAAALLVVAGNPGNMGLCGACFLRDVAGAFGLSAPPAAPRIFRPEVPGVVLGAALLALVRGRFVARSGGYAAVRFLFGVVSAIAALIFLGCPFRMLQRLGGGDVTAWAALPGFLVGVAVAVAAEERGYSPGRTQVAPAPVGLVGPLLFALALTGFFVGGLYLGPGYGEAGKPDHAHALVALGVALAAGAALSATGFCAISAGRALVRRRARKTMAYAALALVAGYAAVAIAAGRFGGSPIAHGAWGWNFAALMALGMAGAFAGGCPVRQLVMTGEGNGDAFAAVVGLLVGGALAHNWGLVSQVATADGPGGPTPRGRIALIACLVGSAVYAWALARSRPPAAATPPASPPPA
ncbi:MAG TPA: YedE family putative selenium transporter [Planctomycetota bacterium]|nr:YedE family putative selenium transporter [Planctomycetota bacterium]